MKLNIFRRSKDEHAAPEKLVTPKNLVEEILDAPVDFNRRTRRSIGLFGRFWKWRGPVEMGNAAQAPRYIRRHYEADYDGSVKRRTRRQRRHRARIIRLAIRRGL